MKSYVVIAEFHDNSSGTRFDVAMSFETALQAALVHGALKSCANNGGQVYGFGPTIVPKWMELRTAHGPAPLLTVETQKADK